MSPQALGHRDCHGAQAPGAAGDEDRLSGFRLHQRKGLYRRERSQRHAGGLRVRQIRRDPGDSRLIHGGILGKGADFAQRHTPVDPFSHRKARGRRAPLCHGSDEFVSHHQGEAIRYDQLDIPPHDHIVQRIDPGGFDFHQDFMRADLGNRNILYDQFPTALPVAFQNGCFHLFSLPIRSSFSWFQCSRPA